MARAMMIPAKTATVPARPSGPDASRITVVIVPGPHESGKASGTTAMFSSSSGE